MSQDKPVPVPTQDTQPYWDGCREHELRLQRCTACGRFQFYPRLYCMSCMSEQLEWTTASGRGTLLSFTVVHRPVTKAFAADVPYVVALVTLDEGPQMMSNLVECDPETVGIGMRLEVVFEDRGVDAAIPQFRPLR